MDLALGRIRTLDRRGHGNVWQRRLDDLHSVDAIVALTRDFIATYSPEYLARLPEDCRPGNIKGDDDIDFWAYRLSRRYDAGNDEPVDGSLLHELLDFFLHALLRIAQLHRLGLDR